MPSKENLLGSHIHWIQQHENNDYLEKKRHKKSSQRENLLGYVQTRMEVSRIGGVYCRRACQGVLQQRSQEAAGTRRRM